MRLNLASLLLGIIFFTYCTNQNPQKMFGRLFGTGTNPIDQQNKHKIKLILKKTYKKKYDNYTNFIKYIVNPYYSKINYVSYTLIHPTTFVKIFKAIPQGEVDSIFLLRLEDEKHKPLYDASRKNIMFKNHYLRKIKKIIVKYNFSIPSDIIHLIFKYYQNKIDENISYIEKVELNFTFLNYDDPIFKNIMNIKFLKHHADIEKINKIRVYKNFNCKVYERVLCRFDYNNLLIRLFCNDLKQKEFKLFKKKKKISNVDLNNFLIFTRKTLKSKKPNQLYLLGHNYCSVYKREVYKIVINGKIVFWIT